MMMRAPILAIALLSAGTATARKCEWGAQQIKIAPWNQGWSFCCPGLSGNVAHFASATYKSNPVVGAAGPDNYSIRPGITGDQMTDHCESRMRDWYDETYHKDLKQYKTSGSYGPANFQTETLGLVFWCHNTITPCQIDITGVTIGEDSTDFAFNSSTTVIEM